MKVSLNISWILLLSMIWLGQVQSASMDYRYKRGPPRPPRPPPLPQYIKKWEQIRPTRNANRPRPIPMEQIAVAPIFVPPPVGPPVAQTPSPLRNYWKTTKIPYQSVPEKPFQIIPDKSFQNVPEKPYQVILERPFQTIPERQFQMIQQRPYQAIPEKPYQVLPQKPFQVIPEKPFHSSPLINGIHEFDYQVQTNNIPTNSITIKQVGEKGPIHTIPAPNLSLADRPIVVEEVYTETRTKPQQTYMQTQQTSIKAHQYQVTEPNEVYIKNTHKGFRDQQVPYGSGAYSNNPNQNYEKPQRQLQVNKLPDLELSGSIPGQSVESQMNQKELFQIINSHLQRDQQHQQQQRQPMYDNYEIPPLPQALVQPQYQQQEISFADYQAMLAQAQLYQSDSTYLNQIQQIAANQNSKTNNQPQHQSFAYERRAQNNYPGDDQPSTFIATNYNFKADATGGIPQDSSKSESSSPYVQEVFDLEESEATNNNVEQRPELENTSTDQENIASAFYTTLPNRQVAETLASLQAAGKINNNLKQVNNPQTKNLKSKTALEIYVPDSQQFKNYDVHPSQEEKDSTQENVQVQDNSELQDQQEDELQDEQDGTSNQENQHFFGSKIRPKQNKQ